MSPKILRGGFPKQGGRSRGAGGRHDEPHAAGLGLDPYPAAHGSRTASSSLRDGGERQAGSQGRTLSAQVSNSVAFTAADLTQIPESLARLKAKPASGFSVGACYQSQSQSRYAVFWILVVTYF